jgi:hypothetical protein
MSRTKNIYQFRGWNGIDASNATSLFEYGFLYNPNAKKDTCNIVYGISVDKEGNYNRFVYSSINWAEILTETWINWEEVAEFCGQSVESLKEWGLGNLQSLISYYGTEEIFGSNYYEGFKINE